MAQKLRFLIDGADRGQPLNPNDFGFTINEDSDLNARIISFNNDLIFGGETYQYLFDLLVTTGGCAIVKVNVSYQCDSAWKPLVDGWLIISECVFDLDKCQVKTRMYDEMFSTKINNNKGIPFSTQSKLTKNLETITPPPIWNVQMFNPATGNWDATEPVGCVAVYDVFKHLVSCMSDNLVDFASTLFEYAIVNDSVSDILMLTNGRAIFSRNQSETVIKFEQLFNALNKKMRLGLGFEKQANGRPLLRIETADYFYQLGASCNLYDQPNIDMQFDTTQLFATVGFGADPFLEQNECDGGATPCSFTQTPFRGFRIESFGMLGKCNTSTELNLQSQEVIFDTNVIEDIYRFNSQSYMDTPVIIDTTLYVVSNVGNFKAKKGDPYGIGGSVYNADFTNEQVSNNWIGGYPNSLFQYLQGFNPTLTDFSVQVLNNSQGFDIISSAFTSYSQFNGTFINFLDEISDPNNIFSGSDYVVPYTGIYNFNASLIRTPIFDSAFGNVTMFVSILHYDSQDNFITKVDGVQVVQNCTSYSNAVASGQFICNEGDIIRVDLTAKTQFLDESAEIFIEPDFLGEWQSTFDGTGQPFQPSELQPIDPNTIKRLLYKFQRPLTMDEIQSILDNTSKPIKIGRHNDPLQVIDTYIKTLNVQSVIQQNANFELKSNKILR